MTSYRELEPLAGQTSPAAVSDVLIRMGFSYQHDMHGVFQQTPGLPIFGQAIGDPPVASPTWAPNALIQIGLIGRSAPPAANRLACDLALFVSKGPLLSQIRVVYGVTTKSPNIVKLWPGKVHTNW